MSNNKDSEPETDKQSSKMNNPALRIAKVCMAFCKLFHLTTALIKKNTYVCILKNTT